MTALSTLITQHALTEATAHDWAAVAVKLNSLTKTIRDETHWTLGLIQSHPSLGIDVARGIANAVKAAADSDPLMQSVLLALSTTGIQLHTPERQAQIDLIGQGLPAEAVAGVKALGIRTVPVVETTPEECQAEWQAELARQAYKVLQTRRQKWDELASQIRSQIETGQLKTKAEIVAAVSAGLES